VSSPARAVIFDLDDTLYPLRRFLLSGFAAVADQVGREAGLAPARILRILRRASGAWRGRELDRLCGSIGLSRSVIPRLVEIIRRHPPRMRLPRETVRVLGALRPRWRVGVLTNGIPDIQRRKVAALGLEELVDAVVFAAECGSGRGKPEAAAFRSAMARLGTVPRRSVFVGDDLVADVLGAQRIGMRTILVGRRPQHPDQCTRVRPDARVRMLRSVPRVAGRLITGGRHAAML
jgi:HAD superfamily hydrolase (TIGR01509 family)